MAMLALLAVYGVGNRTNFAMRLMHAMPISTTHDEIIMKFSTQAWSIEFHISSTNTRLAKWTNCLLNIKTLFNVYWFWCVCLYMGVSKRALSWHWWCIQMVEIVRLIDRSTDGCSMDESLYAGGQTAPYLMCTTLINIKSRYDTYSSICTHHVLLFEIILRLYLECNYWFRANT